MEEQQEREVLDTGILNLNDLAELLDVSKQTARRYINNGRIPAYRVVPGKYLISARQLMEHIEKHTMGNWR